MVTTREKRYIVNSNPNMNEIGKPVGAAELMKESTLDETCVCGTSSMFDDFISPADSMPFCSCRALNFKVPRYCDLIGYSES